MSCTSSVILYLPIEPKIYQWLLIFLIFFYYLLGLVGFLLGGVVCVGIFLYCQRYKQNKEEEKKYQVSIIFHRIHFQRTLLWNTAWWWILQYPFAINQKIDNYVFFYHSTNSIDPQILYSTFSLCFLSLNMVISTKDY